MGNRFLKLTVSVNYERHTFNIKLECWRSFHVYIYIMRHALIWQKPPRPYVLSFVANSIPIQLRYFIIYFIFIYVIFIFLYFCIYYCLPLKPSNTHAALAPMPGLGKEQGLTQFRAFSTPWKASGNLLPINLPLLSFCHNTHSYEEHMISF